MTDLSDEMLNAYLDGELSTDEAHLVESVLSENPRDRVRFVELRKATGLSHAAVSELSRDPVPEFLKDLVLPPAPDRSPVAGVASWPLGLFAGALILALGIGLGAWLIPPSTPSPSWSQIPASTWQQQATRFHQLAVEQNTDAHSPGFDLQQREPALLAAALNAQMEQKLVVPDLSRFGMQVLGARLFIGWSQPLAQIFYQDSEGRLVSLLVVADRGVESRLNYRRGSATPPTLDWRSNDRTFVLVGDYNQEKMMQVADTVTAQTFK